VDATVLVVVVTCLANLFLGLFVLLRNPKARLGQTFFSMTVFISGWTLANHYTDHGASLELNIIFNKLAYLFAFLAISASALFTYYFLGRNKVYPKRIHITVFLGMLAMSVLSATDLVAGTITKNGNALVFKSGPLIIIYLLSVILLFGIIIRNLFIVIKTGQPNQKNQAQIILGSFTTGILIGVIANLVIPLLSHDNFAAARYGPPLLTFFLSTSITYAIVRKHLFDIRLVVARSAAYSLLLATTGGVYALIGFGLLGKVYPGNANSPGHEAVYALLAVVLAFTFQPLSGFFRKITDSVFYRDYYDPQSLLNALGAIMAREIELQRLSDKVLHELVGQMKVTKGFIVIVDDDKIFFEAYTDLARNKYISMSALHNLDRGLVVRDIQENSGALSVYKEYDVQLSVGLSSGNEFLGFLLLGNKKSGDIYNATDIKTLKILANELAVAIHNAKSYTQIQNFNKTLQAKIEEATKQLRDANAHLKELDEIKNEFLSMATHQLNTPLTVVDGYLSMITDGTISEHKEQTEILQKMLHRVRMMKHLVSDFLNVSRIEAGTFVIEPSPVDLNKLISEQVSELGPEAQEKEVFLRFFAPEHPLPLVEVDEQKISQAVMNMIDNAIYYTPKGNVSVYLDGDDQNIIFKVVDNGIGVPDIYKDKLFQKFARADNAKKQRPSGNGVGLYLVKLVVEAHGGSIIFDSSEGKGSTFGFTIPMKVEDDLNLQDVTLQEKEAVSV
jgi:signal transduction histidine kinase